MTFPSIYRRTFHWSGNISTLLLLLLSEILSLHALRKADREQEVVPKPVEQLVLKRRQRFVRRTRDSLQLPRGGEHGGGSLLWPLRQDLQALQHAVEEVHLSPESSGRRVVNGRLGEACRDSSRARPGNEMSNQRSFMASHSPGEFRPSEPRP